MKHSDRPGPWLPPRSAFAGFRFPTEVIVVAVRWYLRYGLLADAARFCRHSPGNRWFVAETYVRVNGVWRYAYRAVDQHG